MSHDCPCGRGTSFANCCAPAIRGEVPARTAEDLMRSRYTAYALREIDYLIATHRPCSGEAPSRSSVARFAASAEWRGLEILRTERGGEDDDEGRVEFVARYFEDGVPHRLHERSRFRREDGQWFYVDGSPGAAAKQGRNDPCGCGSGKKFKKCCGA